MIILAAALLIGVAVWLTRGRRRRPPADDPPPRYPPRPLAGPPVPAGQLARGRIVVSGLIKEYRGRRVVDGMSFVAEPGRVTGFLGPNGAGKTTTLRMLLGLAEPAAGQATIGGCRYAALAQPARQVGAVLEASSAHPDRTGRDHLRILCVTAGLPLARADEVLELTGLGAAGRRPAGGYSLGMRQRLGVAAALLGDPQVLILDEPANGLDPAGLRWMHDLLRALAGRGRTVLVSSHLLAQLERLADDLVIMADGRLVAQGTVGSVLGSMTRASRTLVRTPQLAELTAALGSEAVVTPAGPGEVLVTGPDAAAIGDAARRAGVALHQLVTQRTDLEAAFLELTAQQEAIR